jgi:ABC-type branched-subunit amino acid transport system substrate-binding protein
MQQKKPEQKKPVKICPSCSFENTVSSKRCAKCNRSLAGVLPSNKPVLPDPPRNLEKRTDRRPLVENKPSFPPGIFSNTFWVRNKVWIIATVFVLVLVLIPTLVLRSQIIKVSNTSVTPTPSQTSLTPVLQMLPDGLGEVKASNGESIGVNDGSFAPFDVSLNAQEAPFKQQATSKLHNGDTQSAQSLWQQALSIESNDAETLIYSEDQRVISSGEPYITLVAGVAFNAPFPDNSSESILQGIYVAQHEFNSANHPFQVRILIANSGNLENAHEAEAVAQQIVHIAHKDPTVLGVIGWLYSAISINSESYLVKARIPIISPQSTSDELTKISHYFFRVVPPNKVEASVIVQYAKNTLHIKNPVIFVDPGDSFSQNLAEDIKNTGYTNAPEEIFTTGDKNNQQTFLAKIKDAEQYHPDAFIFTSRSDVDAALFQQALPISGSFTHVPTIAGSGSYSAQPNSYGRWYMVEVAFHGESNVPIARQFTNEYSTDFSGGSLGHSGYNYTIANDHVILAYDATAVTLAAAINSGKMPLTPQALKQALTQITGTQAFQGVSGQIAFGPDGDPINKALVVLSVSSDGHIELQPPIQGCFIKGCRQ